MDKFPALKPNPRDREFKNTAEEVRDRIVFEYIFSGLAHRQLDKEVLLEDPEYTRGYVSMGILHHIGLWDEHKGFFKEASALDAITFLSDQDRLQFKSVILSLMRISDGIYSDDSLDLFQPNPEIPPLVKNVGTSQYTDGVRIEQEFHNFFNPPTSPFYTPRGTARPIKILFNNRIFEAEYRYEGQSDVSRVLQSVRFSPKLKQEFGKVFDEPIGQFTIQAGRDLNHFTFSYASVVVDEYSLDEEEYSEGKEGFRLHRIRERKSEVVKKAKERFLKNTGKIFCEACEFDFNSVYGCRGQNFIEGHHTKLVSEMKEGEKTKVEDIALLCSNCHRIIHRKPLITVEQLRQLILARRHNLE